MLCPALQMNSLVDSIMQHLLSKEVLYEPMKEIGAKYPAWLEANRGKIPDADFDRFSTQHRRARETPRPQALPDSMQQEHRGVAVGGGCPQRRSGVGSLGEVCRVETPGLFLPSRYILRICDLYEKSPNDFAGLMGLLQQMQDCGQPPEDIVKDLAPGMLFGQEGVTPAPGQSGAPPECCVM